MWRQGFLCAFAVFASLLWPAAVPAQMQSTELESGICKTTGGGRFVPIPGFKGEKIDVRLLPDVEYLIERYKIFVTDGYSTDPVHSAQGEHPLGLGLDIVPNKAKGGSWALITRLAVYAEPKAGRPISPFRWVGYDGDAGHGRGHHLHLSWAHSDAKFGEPARTVYTMICPDGSGASEPGAPAPPSGGTGMEDEEVGAGGITADARPKRLAPIAPENG